MATRSQILLNFKNVQMSMLVNVTLQTMVVHSMLINYFAASHWYLNTGITSIGRTQKSLMWLKLKTGWKMIIPMVSRSKKRDFSWKMHCYGHEHRHNIQPALDPSSKQRIKLFYKFWSIWVTDKDFFHANNKSESV